MKLSYKISKSPDFVFDYLTDMQKFVTIHPVITKIVSTGEKTYLVYETLKFGFIPVSFTYPVSIESNPLNKSVIIKATVKKMTHVEMHFKLEQEENQTRVNEEIRFRSFLPVKGMLGKIFKEQHRKLFQNLEQA